MKDPFSQFAQFADHRLGTAGFATDASDEKSKLFHISVESARQQFGWTAKGSNLSGHKFSLNAGFVDAFAPNALADAYQGGHFIAMHSALFVAINEFAMFCFAQARFFPDVGDPSVEVSPEPWDHRVPGLWLLDHTKHGGHVHEMHSRALIPRDSDRFVVSQYLALLMARFVWLHELSHCFNGHVDFVHKHKLALRLYELADPLATLEISKPRTDISLEAISETLKCLEFDADRSAFWASCNIQIGALENIEGIAKLDQGLRLRLTLFGSYAMVWLFEQFQTYLDSQNGASHPSPALRLQNLFRTAQTRILPLSEQMRAAHGQALLQFDAISAVIPGMYGRDDLRARMEGGSEAQELARFDARSEALKSDLVAFEFSDRR